MLSKALDLGVVVEDTDEYRVKLASVNEIEQYVGTGFTPDPAYCYVHVIAMGAGEFYGCNANGDYFNESTLIVRHHTFEEGAQIFKEHKNKPEFGHPSFGKVVKSWYNPGMHRVELLLAVDRKAAPDIVARIERGDHPEVSMGCRIPYDICSLCGNKSAKKSDYCEHIRHQLKRIRSDGKQAYMINVNPTFFDISFVFHRADKIAFTLKKVASDSAGIDHVEDVEDFAAKQAAIDKEIPAEKVIQVLNKSYVHDLLPRMEKLEPDLPAGLLDRIATRHSLGDILLTFLHNAVPLKPTEFTRIIVIQTGLPLNTYPDVLKGVLKATPSAADPFSSANYQPEIENLIEPHLKHRSAFLPFVLDRAAAALHPEKQASYMQPNLDTPYFYGDTPQHYYPLELPTQQVYYQEQRPYATVPVMYGREEYARKVQALAERRPLREPINPLAIGLMMGGLYAAYRGTAGLSSLIKALSSQGAAIGTGALAFAVLDALKPKVNQAMQKHAGFGSNVLYKGVMPFVGIHMLAAHYRDQYARGAELNGLQQTIAEYPDMLSLAAPFALHHLHTALKTPPPIKTASEDGAVEKLADMADNLTAAIVAGTIFHGRGISGLGGVADQIGDAMIINTALDKALSEGAPPSKSDPNWKPAALKGPKSN